MAEQSGKQSTYLLAPILLIAVLFACAVIRGPNILAQSGFGSAILVAAPLILATYGLMSLAVAGRGTVDLAVGPLVAFINVTVVKLNDLGAVTGPFGVFVVALGIGVIYQLLFAFVILFVRVQPIIVALSGFLALTGINLVILPRPGGTAPEWMAAWGLGNTIFSPILAILIIATGAWLLFTKTSFYGSLRMMGFDERAAYTSGVRIYWVRVGAHFIAGLFMGLSAICYTALIASGDPTQGTTLTLTAVTALVLGGVSLAGGRGGVTGAFLGAVNLFLIGYVLATFDFGPIQAFVTQLFYGLILVLSLLLTLLVPAVGRHLSFVSPFGAFIVLSAIVVTIMLQVATSETYVTAPPAPIEHAADLVSRYLLLPPPGIERAALALTALQKIVLAAAAALALFTLTMRVATVEAMSLRLSAFLYVVIGALIFFLFVFIGGQTHAFGYARGLAP